MNEGRADLQRVILQYEKQRAEAIRAKQESEIVLPFVRAALEELDAALGQSENSDVMDRVQSQVQSGKARASRASAGAPPAPVRATPPPVVEPQRPASLTLMQTVDTFEPDAFEVDDFEADDEAEQQVIEAPAAKPAPAFQSFNRSSIASLLDDADKQAKAR